MLVMLIRHRSRDRSQIKTQQMKLPFFHRKAKMNLSEIDSTDVVVIGCLNNVKPASIVKALVWVTLPLSVSNPKVV